MAVGPSEMGVDLALGSGAVYYYLAIWRSLGSEASKFQAESESVRTNK